MKHTALTQETVELPPLGYPQFSTLVGAHPAFSVSRRFSVVRARLLLLKQQRVAALEKRLEELDLKELRPLYLGSFQADANLPRSQVLKNLDEALVDYGKSYALTPPILFSRDKKVGHEIPVESEDSSKHEEAQGTVLTQN